MTSFSTILLKEVAVIRQQSRWMCNASLPLPHRAKSYCRQAYYAHLQMRSTIGQMHACAFDQTLRIWSNAARFVNWSDAQRICPIALRIWPNAQIGQMRLTVTLDCTANQREHPLGSMQISMHKLNSNSILQKLPIVVLLPCNV